MAPLEEYMKFNILRVQSRNRKELTSNRGEDQMKIFKESQGGKRERLE